MREGPTTEAAKVTGALFAIFYGVGTAMIVVKGLVGEALSTIEIVGFTTVSVLGLGLLGLMIATRVRRSRSGKRSLDRESD